MGYSTLVFDDFGIPETLSFGRDLSDQSILVRYRRSAPRHRVAVDHRMTPGAADNFVATLAQALDYDAPSCTHISNYASRKSATMVELCFPAVHDELRLTVTVSESTARRLLSDLAISLEWDLEK